MLAWAAKDIRDALPLKHETRRIALERRRITPEEYEENVKALAAMHAETFAAEGTPRERVMHDSILAARRNRAGRIIERYRIQDREPSIPMCLHVVKLGEIAFAFNPFEMYMDYMHRIQARSPFEQTFIVQLSGDEISASYGYLATERGAWGGGYSASLYCNHVSPAGGQQLVESTLDLLNKA